MNAQAVAEVIRSVGWLPGDEVNHVARARNMIANSSGWAADSLAVSIARRLVAAADGSPAAPASTPALPAPGLSAVESPDILGLDANGHRMTADGCPAGQDPIAYLSAPGVTLSAAGRRVLADLQGLRAQSPESRALLAKAAALKIDTARIQAWATANKTDYMAALRAEVQFREQLRDDLARIGSQGGA